MLSEERLIELLNAKFDPIEKSLSRLENKVESLETKVSSIERILEGIQEDVKLIAINHIRPNPFN